MYAHGYRASYGNVLGARATVIAVAVEVVAARVRALLAPAQICVPPCCAGDCEGCEHAKEDSHAPLLGAREARKVARLRIWSGFCEW